MSADHKYRGWLRYQPCAAPECGRYPGNQAHHHTGHRGMGQKSPDRYMFPLCLQHHTDFHAGSGPFRGWNRERRRAWQDEQAERSWIGYSGLEAS